MMSEFPQDRRTIKKRLSGILLIISVLIISAVLYTNVDAQEEVPPIPQDDVNAVAKQLYCPVCENIPLDVCPTQACEEWRELIRLKLSEGWSDDQIKAFFVDQYGDRVLASPPASGFNWLIYIIPPLAIIAGGFLLFYPTSRCCLIDHRIRQQPN